MPELRSRATVRGQPTFPRSLSQENPNYSFLLPFAQYNLQCPGYYLPVLQGKWVYPHSNSTCRIWNKIISYSAITRDPHRGVWVGGLWEGREGVRWHFFGALAKGDVSSSIALAGRGFLPKSFVLIKYSPLCNLQTETFLQNPIHTFLPCLPKFMSDILCGCGMLRKDFSSLGGACYAHKTNGDFLG